jgi:dolichol kinase
MTQISMQNELIRKALHFMLLLVPIAYCHYGKWHSLIFIASISAIVVGLDYARRTNPQIKIIFAKIFGIVLRKHELEGTKLCGASWVALAACLTFFLFKKEIAVTAFTILVISDAASAIVGRAIPSQAFFEKSRAGAAAFFSTGLAVLIVCGLIFHAQTWFYLFGLFALSCTTIIESRPSLFGIDDNFTIPISFAFIVTFFDIMWNYNY